MRALTSCDIPFLSVAGDLIAHMTITPERETTDAQSAPLIEIDETVAREHGETIIQLREAERYEYEIKPAQKNGDWRLRCGKLAKRRKNLAQHAPDSGRIETGIWCGTLLLELVEGEANDSKSAVATALVEVRSLKVDYRTEYRGMLRRLSEEMAGLIADARSATKVGFRSSFEERTDEGWLQIQLELLRETLDGTDFSAALQRILSFPHERLLTFSDAVPTDKPIRWTPSAVKQLVAGNPRRAVPENHPLRLSAGLSSVAERVHVPRRARDLDTPENRFVKFALREFLSFLTHAQAVFEKHAGWGASAALAKRLAASIEDWLGRGLFREIGEMRFAPLGSPVLQRKAGYRELLHWWLRFRTAAELSWEGGEDLFRAGQRDVASLYEYWLFFELLDWFCRKCRGGQRPDVRELVDGLDQDSPNLKLKKRLELGPFIGTFAGQSRQLKVRFDYNRRFEVTRDRHASGSWTRRLHPDYTLTFWPASLTEAESERRELLVHVHFDAKYRLEDIGNLFGGSENDEMDDELDGNYKRQDLLKMHAYRDAIKRSQGAYVLYPGRNVAAEKFKGFYHEILPGLGAFGVAPNENGSAQGMKPLEDFLDEVLTHLSNRTTAQERASYHFAEAYNLNEKPVQYGALQLAESDIYGDEFRALPPAEAMVLLAWYNNEEQRVLAENENGFVYVRLGRRQGSLHVHPNYALVRYVLLRTHNAVVAPGLLTVREAGYRVFTRKELRAELLKHPQGKGVAKWVDKEAADDEENIYALFKTQPNVIFGKQLWDGHKVMNLIQKFETNARNKLVENVRRASPYPRTLPLRDVLKAKK
jgi:predicted component of viral defense system (DUF524 family)